jgi:hypothetical protein
MLMTTASTHSIEERDAFTAGIGAIACSLSTQEQAERQLVAALQRGDNTSYEVLVREYGALPAVARRIMRNDDDARDRSSGDTN